MPSNPFLAIAGVAGFLGVAAGAFGAHALKGSLPPDLLAIFETGSRYVQVHSLALFCTALLIERRPSAALRAAGWLFSAGLSIFGGSLWLLALSGQRWLGAVAPLGGLALLAGWGLVAYEGYRQRQ
jgi:uncharacterized membrane protein YgdD (TMEM256/DUF423 family)